MLCRRPAPYIQFLRMFAVRAWGSSGRAGEPAQSLHYTTQPGRREGGRKGGGGATKQMSKRNWQVPNTSNFDILHHRQKRSEWVWR